MKKETLLRSSAIGVLALAFFAGGVARAQSPAQAGADQAQAADAVAPGDIIVTAQRRSESLQRAALAIAAVSGDALTKANITDPSRLTTIVPALQIAPSSGPFPQFYLRGVGNFAGNALSEAAIAFNVDGVYVARPSSTFGFFYDLDRVEVLKGPQGTLYGRNATGGAINVITRKPELGKFGGSANLQYGNYEAVRAEAAANIPLGDNAAIRAAGLVIRHDGYMKDGTDDQSDRGGRIQLRVEPTPELRIDLGFDYFNQGGTGVGGLPIAAGQDLDQRIGYGSAAGQAFLTSQPNATMGRRLAPFDFPVYLNNEYWGVSSTIEYQSSIGTFTLVPAYRKADLDYQGNASGFQIGSQEQDKQTSVEARFATDDSKPLRALVGAYYLDQKNAVPTFIVNQQFNYNLQSFTQTNESLAGFGRIVYAPVPEIRLTAAGRYTTEKKHLTGGLLGRTLICVRPSSFFPTFVPGCPNATPFPYSTVAPPPPRFVPGADGTIIIPADVQYTGVNERKSKDNRFTYRVSADWDVTPNNLLYVSYETGFKAGGFFFTADQGEYKPETLKAFTLGSKNSFFDRKLTFNLEAFYWKYNDQQTSLLSLDSEQHTVFATLNIGKATIKGLELETRFAATDTTLLSVDVQYLNARYDSFKYIKPNQNGGVSNGTGCPSSSVTALAYTIDCSGRRPPQAPKWTVNLGAQQTVEMSSGGKIVANVNAHFQTETLVGIEFLPGEFQPKYWLVDGQLSYTTPDGRLTFGGFINNIFNETVSASVQPVPGSFFLSGLVRPPRTYGARLGFNF